jgi:hypothetical protein
LYFAIARKLSVSLLRFRAASALYVLKLEECLAITSVCQRDP